MDRAAYSTDLTDAEWEILAPLFPPPATTGRPRKWSFREILNSIFYAVRGGQAWRLMPHDLLPWKTANFYHRVWRLQGFWERLHTTLREQVRVKAGHDPTPSAAIIDSQSTRTTEAGGPRGYDGGKKINGRKRHILVDTLGLVMGVVVHPADIQDRSGAVLLFNSVGNLFPRIVLDLRVGNVFGSQRRDGFVVRKILTRPAKALIPAPASSDNRHSL